MFMKVLMASLLMLGGVQTVAFAQETAPVTQAQSRPTEESLHQLLEVMQVRKLIEAMSGQLDAAFSNTLKKQLEGRDLTAEDQQRIEQARARLKEVVTKVLNWETMQAIYLQAYGDTFSQAEVDSLITFYSSPTGQAVVAKLPLAMQNAMAATQQRLLTVVPQMQQIARDTVSQIGTHGTGTGAAASKHPSG
jgi:uncharacterized protein